MTLAIFRKTTAVLTIVTGAALSAPAHAGGVPTIDTASLAELISLLNINTDIKEIDQQVLDNALKELKQLQDTHAALTGGRENIANLFDDDVDPMRIANSLTDLSSGNAVNQQVGHRISNLRQELAVMSGTEFFGSGEEDVRAKTYDLVTGSGLATLAVAEENFAGAGTAINRYDAYRKEIAGTEDLKASIDLNTRVQIENGQMLALLLQTLATESRMNAAVLTSGQRNHEITGRVAGNVGSVFGE